jgi:hypothetical protein
MNFCLQMQPFVMHFNFEIRIEKSSFFTILKKWLNPARLQLHNSTRKQQPLISAVQALI